MLVPVQIPEGVAAGTVVEDVFVRESRVATRKSWQRIMVGSLADGTGYFARGVSDRAAGETPDPDAAQPELWRFADDELGRTGARPRIAMSNAEDAGGGKEWAVAFAGGYDSETGAAKLFVVFVDRGVDGWSSGDFVAISTALREPPGPASDAPMANGLGEVALVDIDLNGTADLAYAGDLFGNLHRFDIANTDPSKWGAVRLFQATYGKRAKTRQPITQRPFVRAHPQGDGFFVVFGTGTDHAEKDGASKAIQSIYGIWDPGGTDPATARSGAKGKRLVRRALINVVDESGGSFKWHRVLTGEPPRPIADAPGSNGVYGWYIDLDMPRAERTLQGGSNPDPCGRAPPGPQYPGERAAGGLVPRGDTVFITTVIPSDAQNCFGAPSGSLLAIDITTGGSPSAPVLDLDDDGRIDGGDLVAHQGETQVPGIVFHGGDFSGASHDVGLIANRDGTAVLVVGGGDGQLSLNIGAAAPLKTGRLSWRELGEPVP